MCQKKNNSLNAKDLIIDLVSPLIAREKYIPAYQGKFTCVGVTLAVNDNKEETLKTINVWKQRFDQIQHNLHHVKSVQDLNYAYQHDKLGILFHFQNTAPINDDLSMIEAYYSLGVRMIQLTYNGQNSFGYGCEVEDKGLTPKGREWVSEMNRVGMLIDLSHAGYKTAEDVILASRQPVILSHSNAKTLCHSDRNVPDEIIQGIAKSGGVIGLNAFSAFVKEKVEQATLDQFIDHAQYIAELVGIQHLSLGLDYYTGQWPYVTTEEAIRNYYRNLEKGIWQPKNYPRPPHKWVTSLETPDKIHNLKPALLFRGFSQEAIAMIQATNLVRVFSQVWK